MTAPQRSAWGAASVLVSIAALVVALVGLRTAQTSFELAHRVNQPAFVVIATPLGKPLIPGEQDVRLHLRNIGPAPALDVMPAAESSVIGLTNMGRHWLRLPWDYLQVLAPGETGKEFALAKPLILTDDECDRYNKGTATLQIDVTLYYRTLADETKQATTLHLFYYRETGGWLGGSKFELIERPKPS